ncbi:quinoprotein relay system zinc metallohydrolase 2 [Geminicoccus flavidas]|uniref:quinoprotein relay system zinc metallohydrolase 2 n=1 Tax=Geminicoccus flavidas TaxID=2506407 RepID=UPI00135B7668
MQYGTTRRTLLQAGICLCGCLAAGRAAGSAGLAEVAPGVFVRRGPDEDASSANANGIANIGCIIGDDAVLVTDPGGSLADGQWLRTEIRRRTERPIRHVVVSHVHPDHCFGTGAFLDDAPEILGHHRLGAALAARGDYYQRQLTELLGDAAAGPVVPPTRPVGEEETVLDLGGRRIRLAAYATAHSDCDLVMLDEGSGLLFPADLLFVGRAPSLDGSLSGWLTALDRLRASGAVRAVPGHGPATVELDQAIGPLERYLTILQDETRSALAAGRTMEEAIATVATAERDHWALFDDYHGRNVTQAYKELEWE